MTIQNQISKIDYIGDGVSDCYHIPFYFLKDEISVYFDNLEHPQENNLDYEIVAQNKVGGEIKFTNPPKLNTRITILRNIPLTQTTTFIEGENFPAQDYEISLDRIVMQLQMLKEILDRTIKVAHNSKITPEDVLELISDINKNYTTIKKVPILASAINTMYEEMLAYLDKNIKYSSLILNTSDIIEDATYSSYPYHLDIPLPEAKSTHIPTVVFSLNDVLSANYAPTSECFDGYVRIYLKQIPSSPTIEIPSILLQ